MATTTCPYCNKIAHMTPQWSHNAPGNIVEGVLACDNCGRVSLALIAGTAVTQASQLSGKISSGGFDVKWLPAAGEAAEFPDVPPHIADAAAEAVACLSIGADRGAILLARTVIEATAKEKMITTGHLIQKIDAMLAAQLIRPDVAEAGHEIRLMGNDMAHGDNLDAVDHLEADEIVALMGEVLEEVFQAPARLAARKARRAST